MGDFLLCILLGNNDLCLVEDCYLKILNLTDSYENIVNLRRTRLGLLLAGMILLALSAPIKKYCPDTTQRIIIRIAAILYAPFCIIFYIMFLGLLSLFMYGMKGMF